MVKARIRLNTGELVTREFEDKAALFRFLSEGHELVKAIEIK